MTVGGPAAPESEDPLVNKVLSERYRILKKLGEGGMGVVYLAEHIVIEKKIALKVLFPDLTRRSDLVQRFMQEAKSASRIGHENVIDITDFGQSPEGYVFIAMEYLVGQDLGQLLKASGPMSWLRAQPIVLQIVKALRAAHERGIVHRDMKPENVFVLPRDDGREFVKVLDFGIAKVLGLDEDAPRLTRTGMIFGTPEYMSPEQAQGQQVDHRVDIYAVGCILYHMLTGEVPFKAESFMGILSKHMLEMPVPPGTRNPTIDPRVEAVINRAMEKDPALRFQTMREFVDALVPLGHMPDMSGAISLSKGMPIHPVAPTSSGPLTDARMTTPVAHPTPHATKEVANRGSQPLSPTNPEARRSQTEFFSRAEDGPPVRARSNNSLVMIIGLAVVALAVVAFLALRAPSAGPETAKAPAPSPEKVAVPAPATPPTAAPVPATQPPVVAPATSAAHASTGAEPGAVRAPGSRKSKESPRTHRSSREAIDALMQSQDGEGAPKKAAAAHPAGALTPNELKNPFAP